MTRTTLLGGFCLLLLAGCGSPVGEACRLTGSGFSMRDPCRDKCLALWDVQCPDGSIVQPAVCSGKRSCAPGDCPSGQACYSFDDPFDEVTYCVPARVCVGIATPEALRAWELAAQERARATREKFGKTKRATKPLP